MANCYTNSLELAIKNNIKTIAFPSISTGVYGYPKNRAAIIAVHAVESFLKSHNQIDKVIFVAYDEENYSIYEKLLK